jgi:hypothetical protein
MMSHHFLITAFALLISSFSSSVLAIQMAPLEVPPPLHQAHFFEGSKREDLSRTDGAFLVEVHVGAKTFTEWKYQRTDQAAVDFIADFLGTRPTCSAFFVANKLNKMLIGSSRHCFGFNPSDLLFRKDVTLVDFATGHVGRATRIVAEDAGSDFFIFEANFGPATRLIRTKMKFLKIGITETAKEQPIRFFGFPSDEERHGRATVSNHCKLFPSDYDPAWTKFYALFLNKESSEASAKVTDSESDSFKSAISTVGDSSIPLRHNCNIYGGNSGGPGTSESAPLTLVGLPFSYNPSTEVFGADKYGILETPNRLAILKREVFAKEGIAVEVRD